MSSQLVKSQQFTKLLGLKYPIIQAPMGGVTTTKLASEVTLNGGLGSLPVSGIDLRAGISQLINTVAEYQGLISRSSLKNVVNLNFFCHEIYTPPSRKQVADWLKLYHDTIPELNEAQYAESLQIKNGNISFKEIEESYPSVLDELFTYWKENKHLVPKVISFHFGYPKSRTIEALHDLGIFVLVTATSLDEAQTLIRQGVDGLVCQGYEAGGHRGNFLHNKESEPTEKSEKFENRKDLSTNDLFNVIYQWVQENNSKVHLIPAGGIMDANTISKYLFSGASAVQLGTIFLSSPGSNSSVSRLFDSDVQKQGLPPTQMVAQVSGKPARSITSEFIKRLTLSSEKGQYDLPAYGYSYSLYKQMKSTMKNVSIDLSFPLAGANYPDLRPQWLGRGAGEIVSTLGNQIDNIAKSK